MVATRLLISSVLAASCFLLSAASQAHAQGTPTPTTAWFENDHTGAAPRSIQILTTATTVVNTDVLAQRYSRGILGDTYLPVVGVPVTMTVTGGGVTGTFGTVTNGAGIAGWTITGLPLGVTTFTCTLRYNGGDLRGVVLAPATATFNITRVNR